MNKKKEVVFEINTEIRDVLLEEGATDAYKCYQCAKCTSICPWFQVGTYEFLTFRFPIETLLGFVANSEEKEALAHEVDRIFRCVGCEACIYQCPFEINIPNILRAARRLLVDFGSYPETLKAIVQKTHNVGNPLGEPREKRTRWAQDLDIRMYNPTMEYVYFACCFPAYDTRTQRVARATAMILKRCNITFGILGAEESCCGETVRKIGAEKVFSELVGMNSALFKNAGVKKLLVTSPHCLNTFKKEYPERDTVEVIHATQYFAKAIHDGTLVPKNPFNRKVVYHDPCRLGRQNGIYDEPRAVLTSIPGLTLLDVEDFSRELSLCCGGGSGGLWMDWQKDERIVDIRLQQLLGTGAEVIAVACPYCLQMFEETLKSMNSSVQVLDIAEILYAALE